jgi:hypothetical protein
MIYQIISVTVLVMILIYVGNVVEMVVPVVIMFVNFHSSVMELDPVYVMVWILVVVVMKLVLQVVIIYVDLN